MQEINVNLRKYNYIFKTEYAKWKRIFRETFLSVYSSETLYLLFFIVLWYVFITSFTLRKLFFFGRSVLLVVHTNKFSLFQIVILFGLIIVSFVSKNKLRRKVSKLKDFLEYESRYLIRARKFGLNLSLCEPVLCNYIFSFSSGWKHVKKTENKK